jgi:hypothetical protein
LFEQRVAHLRVRAVYIARKKYGVTLRRSRIHHIRRGEPVLSAKRAAASSVRRGPSYGRLLAARCATAASRRFVGHVKFSLIVFFQNTSINAKKNLHFFFNLEILYFNFSENSF